MLRDQVRRYPLFKLLSNHQLDLWLSMGEEVTFATGETIFQEGSAGVWAFLILEGQVRVLRKGGRERSLGLSGSGEFVGEYALLAPHNNTASCRAAAPTRVLRVPLLPLRIAIDAMPAVRSNLKNWLRLHALVHYLRNQPFLGFMSGPSGLKLLHHLHQVSFDALRTIQTDGLADDCWFVIEAGQVILHAKNGPPAELGPGDCFGEKSLLGRTGLPFAVALTKTRCQCLRRSDFAPASPENSHASLQSFNAPRTQAYPWIGQHHASDCGVAALAMIAKYHGVDCTLDQLRQKVRIGDLGASLMELQRAATSFGMRSQAAFVSSWQYAQLARPFLAHLKHGHYVVVYEQDDRRVIVGDPASGLVHWSASFFEQQCSGRILLIANRK